MSSDQRIADIKHQLGEAVNRIDTIQSGRQQPLLTKISNHFKTQSGSIINVVLTASLFAVAIGRLQQKQRHEAERQDWQEKQQKIDLERQRLSQQVSGLQRQFVQLTTGVQRELDDGGYRLGPVKSRLQQLLADFSMTSSPQASQQQLDARKQVPPQTSHPQPSLLNPAPENRLPPQPKTSSKDMMI